MSCARVINQDVAHHLRGDAKEMSAILPIHHPLIDQTKIDLVD